MLKIKSKVWLEKEGKLVFGEGRLEILKAVEKTCSLSRAAKELGITFRRVWSQVLSSEKALGEKLVEKEKGGRGGGGSKITAQAKKMMEKFEVLNKEVKNFTDKKFKEVFNEEV